MICHELELLILLFKNSNVLSDPVKLRALLYEYTKDNIHQSYTTARTYLYTELSSEMIYGNNQAIKYAHLEDTYERNINCEHIVPQSMFKQTDSHGI